jgi:hypothetical protein
VSGLLITSVLLLFFQSQRSYTIDVARAEVQQNLRTALEVLSVDGRLAGSNIDNLAISPIVARAHPEDAQYGDVLVIRSNPLNLSFIVCDSNGLNGNQNNVNLRWTGNPAGRPVECQNQEAIADRILADFQAARVAAGGEMVLTMFNVCDPEGMLETFIHRGENFAGANRQLHKLANTPPWQWDHSWNQPAPGCRSEVMSISEQLYYVTAQGVGTPDRPVLVREVGGQIAPIADNVRSLRVSFVLDNVLDASGRLVIADRPPVQGGITQWRLVRSVQVDLTVASSRPVGPGGRWVQTGETQINFRNILF